MSLTPPVDQPVPADLPISPVTKIEQTEERKGILCPTAEDLRNAILLYGMYGTRPELIKPEEAQLSIDERLRSLHERITEKERLYGDPYEPLQFFSENVLKCLGETPYLEASVDRSLLGTAFTKTGIVAAKLGDQYFFHIEPTNWGGDCI